MKIIALIAVGAGFLLASTFVWSSFSNPFLVLDMRNAPQLPRNFRATNVLPARINTTGLADLHMAGGGQFSKLAFVKILENLKAKKILVVDLRQESHGMLNSNAISWYGPRNSTNANKSISEIEAGQAALLAALGKEKIAVVNNLIQKTAYGKIEKVKPTEYVVHQTESEEAFVTSIGQAYKRIFVQDFHAPTTAEVNRFIEIIKKHPKDKWIYFHCRAGIGRTTVFMTILDMMRNAKQVSFENILERQKVLGGKDLTQLPESKRHFKYQWAVERLEFLKKFYVYAHDNQDNFKTAWSDNHK